MEKLIELDKLVLLAINGAFSSFFDPIMLFFSNIPVWLPLYAGLLVWMFFPKHYGKRSIGRTTEYTPSYLIGIIGVVAAFACFALTDQCSSLIKDLVERPRPGHDPSLEGMVRLISGAGGAYGFISGHACNSFGLAVITSLIFRKKWWTISINCWALIVSYSRIYLGRHFPLDVICGAIIGAAIAIALFFLYKLAVSALEKLFKRKCSAS